MADLPILTPADLHKVPQTTKNAVSNVISFNVLASYLFREGVAYKVDNVFMVADDLNLEPIDIAKDATDKRIMPDIRYEGITITTTNDPNTPATTIPSTAGRTTKDGQIIEGIGALSNVSNLTRFPGGISWISAPNSLWGDHSRAFDLSNPAVPMVAGVQAFVGGNGSSAPAGYTNIYYLGASGAANPLHGATNLFRNLGCRYTGLEVNIDRTTGFLQIGAGTISGWYDQEIKIAQNGKQPFYITYGIDTNKYTIANSPSLVMEIAELKKAVSGNPPTIALDTIQTAQWVAHQIYIDPSTQNIYLFINTVLSLQQMPILDTTTAWKILNSYATGHFTNYAIHNLAIQNWLLLAFVVVPGNATDLSAVKIIQAHPFFPGYGSALHPSVPSPSDSPNGGKLKTNNNLYYIAYDFDGLLINLAATLKNNYLFMYNDRSELGIIEAEYTTTTTPTPWIDLKGSGGCGMQVSGFDGNLEAYTQFYYLYYDRFAYQDNDRGGGIANKEIRIDVSSSAVTYPTYATIDYKNLFYAPSNPGNQYGMIFRNNISIPKLSSSTSVMYHGLLGSPSIPGLNDNVVGAASYFQYTDDFRKARATRGSADSVVIVESVIKNTAAITDEYCSWLFANALTPTAQALITQLMNLIGGTVAEQVKTVYEAVKKAGMLCDVGKSINTIIGYFIENNSATDQIEYCLTGCHGLQYWDSGTTALGVIKLNPSAYPVVAIQPADVVTLTSGEMSPLQATFFWLAIRTNYLFFIGSSLMAIGNTGGLGMLERPLVQVSEIALS